MYVRGSNEIKGINLRDEHDVKLTAFTDNLLKVLNDFGLCSGLKLNNSKLEACYLGTSSPTEFHTNVDIKSCIEILGIFFS